MKMMGLGVCGQQKLIIWLLEEKGDDKKGYNLLHGKICNSTNLIV